MINDLIYSCNRFPVSRRHIKRIIVPVALLGVELEAKPRMSRMASAAPPSPATVKKRAETSVCFPTSERNFA
jgi:hypothetical protein